MTPPQMRNVQDFRRLAVVGSRWRSTWLKATCTVVRVGAVPVVRGIRDDGTTFSRARIDLPWIDYLAFDGDTMYLLSSPTQTPDGSRAWRYLGQAHGPVEQPPADPAIVRACRVDLLQPGDVVHGPARQYAGRTPGYTVERVDLETVPATVHTREGWPLRHAAWQLLATIAGSAPQRCEPMPTVLPPPGGPARVYLGINTVAWLARPELADVPKCVSRNRLAGYRGRRIPRSSSPVLLDSGGFTELKEHGRWRQSPAEYVAEIRELVDQLGRDAVVGVAQQDLMCESVVIEGGTTKDGTFVGTRRWLDPQHRLGLDEMVHLHQQLGVANFVTLRRLAPDLPIFPVLQGQSVGQYLRHTGMFLAAGVSFLDEPLVGLGSVCRRQGTQATAAIVRALGGIRLHGFGVGVAGLNLYGTRVISTDSAAWSYDGRRAVGRCPHGLVKWEANCPDRARRWWESATGRVTGALVAPVAPVRRLPHVEQLALFDAANPDDPSNPQEQPWTANEPPTP